MSRETDQSRDCVTHYLKEIRKYPILTREEESSVARRLQTASGDDTACQELVTSNLAFVVKVANEYRNLGLPFEDLLNEGNLGLIEAARHFDPSRGTRFLTYAIFWIRKSILRAVARQANLVRLPTYQVKRLRLVGKAERALAATLGRAADREELSEKLQLSAATLDDLMQLRTRELSLDEPAGGDAASPRVDLLVDERAPDPDDRVIEDELRGRIRAAVGRLRPQERAVIVARFGLEGGRPRTLREVADTLGLSHEGVRQIEARAMHHLRRAIARRRPGGPRPRAHLGGALARVPA
jgi:RNA polymerase primary sigma factor